MAYGIKAGSYTIHGPVNGSLDLHQSYTVYQGDGLLLASFYAADGDLEAAVARAEAFCESAAAIEKLKSVLADIAAMHPGDQPASSALSDEQWLRKHIIEMRVKATDALNQTS